MAGSSDNDENHWPGYVDALTTMTMMLIFVMMILAVAMFSMSENVSRGFVERIAQAAGLPPGGEGLSTEAFASEVADKLEQRATQFAGQKTPGDGGASEIESDVPGKGMGGARLAALPEGETRRAESGAAAAIAPPPSTVTVTRSPALLTLGFRSRATLLDAPAREETQAFAMRMNGSLSGPPTAAPRFELRAYASTESGALSDSRRVAYYRAMSVRTALIGSGVDAGRITIQIEDRARAADGDLVHITARGGA